MKSHRTGHRLTSKEAALVLGVSEASVKRWADSGALASQKTAGGHRRFRPEDVAHFKREKRLGVGLRDGVQARTFSPEGSPAGATARPAESVEVLTEALFTALVRARPEEVTALVVNSYLQGMTLASVFDQLLSPAMQKIGDLWHRGELTVTQEHLATRAAAHALRTLGNVIEARPANNLLALCSSTEDDFHELPVRCAELILEHEGWEVINVGANTPFYALAEAVARLHPRLVCVASTILSNLDRAAKEFKDLRAAADREGASIVLGGAGFADEAVRRRLPAELYAESFRQLLDFTTTFSRD